jgi:alpha-methylacyl-CoA racemase
VLTLAEAPGHAHNAARGTYVEHEGVTQPAPVPRLSRTPGRIAAGSQVVPLDPDAVLAAWKA